MQNDQEVYAEVVKNNPFWEIYDSQFEILIPSSLPELSEIVPPDIPIPIEAYLSYLLFIVLAIACFFFIKKNRKNNLPAVYYDEKENWYYYQFRGEESQWLSGDESWLPKHYYFDKEQGSFYFNDGYNEARWVTLEELNSTTSQESDSTPAAVFPVLIVIAGYFISNYFFGPRNDPAYEEYLLLLDKREAELSLFDPFEGMCELSSRDSLIPQQMTVRILYDLPAGSNPPIAVESYSYLEGDILRTNNGDVSLPRINFIADEAPDIAGNSSQIINFPELSYVDSDCSQGNTFIWEYDSNTDDYGPHLVPVSRLKTLSLGSESGLYENNLFGYYDSDYLINASSYEVRTRTYIYSTDEFFDCGVDSTGAIYSPGFTGQGNGLTGRIVPWDSSPPEKIEVPEFQLCSSVSHLEFRSQ